MGGCLHANITAGVYLAKVPSTTYQGVNLSLSAASHPLPACRCYYSQITLQPELEEEYLIQNTSKTLIYRSVLTNQSTILLPVHLSIS